MKKNFLLLLAIVACLFGCSKNELAVTPVDEQREAEFTIIEESDMSGAELFEAATSSLKDIEGLDLGELSRAYNTAVGEMEVADNMTTKAVSVPLLYRVTRIYYLTKDEANQDVTVSALIIYPLARRITKVMLINHGTHIGIAMIPSQGTSVEAVAAASGALCILPDYIGVGASSSHPDLYLNAEVHGRTSTDALLTLLDFAQHQRLNLARNYDTYILGYSQGGSVSLATLKSIQQNLTQSQQAQLHIKKVICGDGPYDLRCTFESFLADEQAGKTMGLGSVVPLVINSMFNSYPDEMAQFNYEDFFTPWALSTGIPQAIRNNDETIIEMFQMNNIALSQILNMTYLQNNPEAFNTLLSLMDRQNLCTGWSPQYKLQFFHCNPDGIVSYQNFVNAYAGLNNSNVLTPETPSSAIMNGNPLLEHIYGMTVMMSNLLAGNYY